MSYKREDIAWFIIENLERNQEDLKKQFSEFRKKNGFFYVDDFLTTDLAHEIYVKFPNPE